MLRATFAGLALTLGALAGLHEDASAAGRSPAIGGRPAAVAPPGGQGWRGFGQRVEGGRRHVQGQDRHGRHRGRFLGGPALYGYDPGAQTVVTREVEIERPAPADPFAFANLPVRAGIPYSPRPEPTIYRLEGGRDRPVTRVIRIDEAQGAGARTRHAHAETGALLLTVPGR